MSNSETLKYRTNDSEIEIRLTEEGEAYLSQSAMAGLFGKSKPTVNHHLKALEPTVSTVRRYETVAPNGKAYSVTHYPMSIVLEIGRKIRSEEGEKLKAFVEAKLAEKGKHSSESIIIYNNGGISLPVTVSPDEDTVWLTQNQIAELFGTTVQNVSAHIQNIREDGELDCTQFFKKSLNNPLEEGSGRSAERYNLDVILAVGYRVKSGRAVRFRRWASGILKGYIYKGSALDERRLLAHDSNLEDLNRTVVSLIARREEDKIEFDRRLVTLEDLAKDQIIPPSAMFFEGEFVETRDFFTRLFASAKHEIIIVDPYLDGRILTLLLHAKEGVSISLLKGNKSKFSDVDACAYAAEHGPLRVGEILDFHDRFTFVDDHAYFVGASFNYMGRKTFALVEVSTASFVQRLKEHIFKSWDGTSKKYD